MKGGILSWEERQSIVLSRKYKHVRIIYPEEKEASASSLSDSDQNPGSVFFLHFHQIEVTVLLLIVLQGIDQLFCRIPQRKQLLLRILFRISRDHSPDPAAFQKGKGNGKNDGNAEFRCFNAYDHPVILR